MSSRIRRTFIIIVKAMFICIAFVYIHNYIDIWSSLQGVNEIQWNLHILDNLGTVVSVRNREVSSFQGSKCTQS